jgi:hypothetical protein
LLLGALAAAAGCQTLIGIEDLEQAPIAPGGGADASAGDATDAAAGKDAQDVSADAGSGGVGGADGAAVDAKDAVTELEGGGAGGEGGGVGGSAGSAGMDAGGSAGSAASDAGGGGLGGSGGAAGGDAGGQGGAAGLDAGAEVGGSAGASGQAGADASAGAGGKAGADGGGGAAGSAGTDASVEGGGSGGAGTAGGAGAGATSGSGGSAGGSGCGACTVHEQCWNNQRCVAKIVVLPNGESIDSTEVTRSQYDAWLASNPAIYASGACTFKQTHLPDSSCMTHPVVCKAPASCGDHPQVCIDWCDGAGYCAAIGRKLCGSPAGGPAEYPNWEDAAKSLWFYACTSNGANTYPYGGLYKPSWCNGLGGAGTTVPVASMGSCVSIVGGFGGVYDLSGNVLEWEDSCVGGDASTGRCRFRGGSFVMGENDLKCRFGGDDQRSFKSGDVGFRCCSKP